MFLASDQGSVVVCHLVLFCNTFEAPPKCPWSTRFTTCISYRAIIKTLEHEQGQHLVPRSNSCLWPALIIELRMKLTKRVRAPMCAYVRVRVPMCAYMRVRAPTCAYLYATRIFRSHDHESSQYAHVRIGFNTLNFERDTRTDYWRTFYGSSSEASFHHCIWGKFTNRCQVLHLPTAMSPKELPKIIPR